MPGNSWHQEKVSNHSITKQLGVSPPTVIGRFGAGGVPALTAKPTRHRLRRALTPELEKKILDATFKTKPPDAIQWTVRQKARLHQMGSRQLLAAVGSVWFDRP
jgi:hypothetical protein